MEFILFVAAIAIICASFTLGPLLDLSSMIGITMSIVPALVVWFYLWKTARKPAMKDTMMYLMIASSVGLSLLWASWYLMPHQA